MLDDDEDDDKDDEDQVFDKWCEFPCPSNGTKHEISISCVSMVNTCENVYLNASLYDPPQFSGFAERVNAM